MSRSRRFSSSSAAEIVPDKDLCRHVSQSQKRGATTRYPGQDCARLTCAGSAADLDRAPKTVLLDVVLKCFLVLRTTLTEDRSVDGMRAQGRQVDHLDPDPSSGRV